MLYTDADYKSELAPYLDPQERLLWTGKPKGGFQLHAADAFLIPFSIIWCGFSIFWVIMAAQVSVYFALFGTPFVLVGVYLVFGRFIVDKRRRDSTVYGLTEQRILIKSGKLKMQVQSFHISSLPTIDLIETNDGRGTLSFGPKISQAAITFTNGSWPGMKAIPSFYQIQDARKVYTKIIELKNPEK